METDKQTAPSPDETVDTETLPKESDKTIPDQVESYEQTPIIKETDESVNIILE